MIAVIVKHMVMQTWSKEKIYVVLKESTYITDKFQVSHNSSIGHPNPNSWFNGKRLKALANTV